MQDAYTDTASSHIACTLHSLVGTLLRLHGGLPLLLALGPVPVPQDVLVLVRRYILCGFECLGYQLRIHVSTKQIV